VQVDRSGERVPLTPDQFRKLWQDLRPRYPEVFVCSSQEILGWHRREAAECEDAMAWPGAVIHLNALIEAEPRSWTLLARRGEAYAELGRWHESINDASKAIALRPAQDQLWKLEGLWLLRGEAHAELGEWKKAAADLTRAIEDAGEDAVLGNGLALALVHLAQGDIDRYRGVCARLLRDFAQRNDVESAIALAWACTLKPEAVEDREAVVRRAKAALDAASEESERLQSLQVLGAATYRAGRLEEAIGHLSAAMKAPPEPGPPRVKFEPDPGTPGGASSGSIARGDPLAWLFLSMAHHRLGHRDEARKWLDKAVAAIDRVTSGQGPSDSASSGSRIDWKTRLAYRVLRSEAESMLSGAGATRTEAPAANDADQRPKSPK
jgi:tetratricopeptide (TPR) repeat protein